MNTKEQINIFIVDDNMAFTLALKENIEIAFSKMSLKVHPFTTGDTCMMKFREMEPQVVILDYYLNSKYPDAEDGVEILQRIKKENEETNVIMLSGNDEIDIAIRSFNNGAFDYIIKTETKFKMINNSLANLFSMMGSKSDAKKYRYVVVGLCLCIAFILGLVIATKTFSPLVIK